MREATEDVNEAATGDAVKFRSTGCQKHLSFKYRTDVPTR